MNEEMLNYFHDYFDEMQSIKTLTIDSLAVLEENKEIARDPRRNRAQYKSGLRDLLDDRKTRRYK